MATQATVTLNPVVRGDDMLARVATFSVNDAAPTITSATFRIHNLLSADCACAGDEVTIPAVAKTVTAKWPVGTHEWDLQITIDGISKTWLRGTIAVLENER